MKRVPWFPLVLGPWLLAACQRYAPEPLELGDHRANVERRDPAGPDVVAYAQRLNAAAAAKPYDVTDGLSLREAEAVALFYNPQLRVARLRARVPRVGAARAGRWTDPELAIDGERIIESVAHPWVLAGTLNLTLPLSGRLGVQRQRALAEATAAELRAMAEERRVLAELAAEWADWSAATERVALATRVVADLDALAAHAAKIRQAGELGPLDERLFRIERVSQAAKLRGHAAHARQAELALKARLGLAPSAGVTFVPELGVGAVLRRDQKGDGSGGDLAARVAGHPRARAAEAEYAVAERALELAVREQYPDLRIGGGFGTDEGVERIPFGAALPLPLFNGNRGAIAEARAARDASRAAAEGEYEQLLAEAAAAESRREAARAQLDFLEKELAPLADQQLADARRLAGLGEFDALVLLESIKSAHDAKLAILDARVNVTLAAARLDALLGDDPPAPPSTSPTDGGQQP